MKICLVYHCVFSIDNRRLPAAEAIVTSQMKALKDSGLLDAASNFFIGVNGEYGTSPVTLPDKATAVYHGGQCKNELRTLRILEKWLPGHEGWAVLYFHGKGATHAIGNGNSDAWRNCMENVVIKNWERSVRDLETHDISGCHYMEPPETPEGQRIMAGNFWWARADYLLQLPSMMERDRIKVSGIDSPDSRYEAEVWIGNGAAKPKVKDYCGPTWNPGKPHLNT